MDNRTLDYEKIAAFISERRKAKQLTQKQLAELLGVTDRAVSKWERGKSFPDVSLLLPLCEALDISTGEFFAGEKKQPAEQEHLTHEEAGELVVTGARGYLKQERKKLLKWCAVVGVIAALLILAGYFFWQGKQPTDFAAGEFSVGTIRLQQRDGTIATLDTLDETMERHLKALLRDLERGEAVGKKQTLLKDGYVEIEDWELFTVTVMKMKRIRLPIIICRAISMTFTEWWKITSKNRTTLIRGKSISTLGIGRCSCRLR